jgi:ssDNA-binding Zn-finger/Zn-ribbon topoisomerase 1
MQGISPVTRLGFFSYAQCCKSHKLLTCKGLLVSNHNFKKPLKSRVSLTYQIKGPADRVGEVLKSPVFLYLIMTHKNNRLPLVEYIEHDSPLTGDPTAWKINADLFAMQWHLSDGVSSDDMTPRSYGGILKQLEDNRWQWRVKIFFLELNYFVSVETMLSDNPQSLHITHYETASDTFNRQPKSCIEWTVKPIDEKTSNVEMTVLTVNNSKEAASYLLTCLERLVPISDIFCYREQLSAELARQSAEKARLAEEERLERAKLDELRTRKDEESKRQHEEKSQRIARDLCLKCGAPCVQRRRKSDGHLFFGCSRHFETKCGGARAIPCPKCGWEMVEKPRSAGGTFLGCPRWPECKGGRSVDQRLTGRTAVGTRNKRTYRSSNSENALAEFEEDFAELDKVYNRQKFDEEWWDEWGEAIHSDDPRERPQNYDNKFLEDD